MVLFLGSTFEQPGGFSNASDALLIKIDIEKGPQAASSRVMGNSAANVGVNA